MRRIGIIGAGNMGKLHASLIRKNMEARVAAVCDADPSRARSLAAESGAAVFEDAAGLLASELDMVFIALPNTSHAPIAELALDRGLDVFVEKPFATSMEDAELLMEAKRKSGKRLFVGLNRRFAPVYAEARRIVASPGFDPMNLNAIQNDGDMRNPPWATDAALTGGFLYDTTIHFLDMAEFLMGRITEISAVGSTAFYPIPDGFAIMLRFEPRRDRSRFGVISTCGYGSWMSPFERVQVVGDHRTFVTEELDGIRYSPGLGGLVEAKEYTKLPFEEKWGYARMHESIFAALAGGGPSQADAEAGFRSVELAAACERSAASKGAAVRV